MGTMGQCGCVVQATQCQRLQLSFQYKTLDMGCQKYQAVKTRLLLHQNQFKAQRHRLLYVWTGFALFQSLLAKAMVSTS